MTLQCSQRRLQVALCKQRTTDSRLPLGRGPCKAEPKMKAHVCVFMLATSQVLYKAIPWCRGAATTWAPHLRCAVVETKYVVRSSFAAS